MKPQMTQVKKTSSQPKKNISEPWEKVCSVGPPAIFAFVELI